MYVKEFWIKFRVAVKSIVAQCLLLTWSQGILYTEYIKFGGGGLKLITFILLFQCNTNFF